MTSVSQLIRNTLTNSVAVAATAIIGFMLVPILLGAYGTERYGLLVLARNLLPVGLLGLLTLGLPEATTRYVARYQARNERDKACSVVVRHVRLALVIGTFSGVVVSAGAELVATYILGVPDAYKESFRLIVLASAVALPFQFFGEVARGALEGLQKYTIVRGAEVAGSMVFFGIALWISVTKIGYEYVAMAYVLISTIRYLFYALYAWYAGSMNRQGASSLDQEESIQILTHAMRFFHGKSLSIVQNYVPSLLLAHIAGPYAVGLFDLLMRIPRLMKVVGGMLTTAMLPYAAQMDALGKHENTRHVIYSATGFTLMLLVPAATGIARYSGDILNLWVGEEYVNYASSLSVAMMGVVLISWSNVSNIMLASRLDGIRILNRISLYQVVVFLGIPLLLYKNMDPVKLFIGIFAIVYGIASPVQIAIAGKAFRVSVYAQIRRIVLSFISLLPAFWVSMAMNEWSDKGWYYLIGKISIWCILSWTVFFIFVLDCKEKALFRAVKIFR